MAARESTRSRWPTPTQREGPGAHDRRAAAREGARDAVRRPRVEAQARVVRDPAAVELGAGGEERARAGRRMGEAAGQAGAALDIGQAEGVRHRHRRGLCRGPAPLRSNHFLRDLAKPVLERDSHAKVQMRRKVRGLRQVERSVLDERRKSSNPCASSGEVVLPTPSASASAAPTVASVAPGAAHSEAQEDRPRVCRGDPRILNDDQGGPLDPPGLRMAEALGEVRASLQRCVGSKKGGPAMAS